MVADETFVLQMQRNSGGALNNSQRGNAVLTSGDGIKKKKKKASLH